MERFWIDANIVVRLLTNDPTDQASRAQQWMDRVDRKEIGLVLDRTVVAEIIWTMKSFYEYSMAEISEVLIPLLSSESIDVEDRDLLAAAIELSRDKNVDFLDAYLALRAAEHDETVCTFDKTDFKKLPSKWVTP
jgi:predicted nucleic acid-binding protein